MTVRYMTRRDWTTHGPRVPLEPLPATVFGLAIHWPGMTGDARAPRTQAAVAERLEAYRVMHTSPGGIGTVNGGSDIAYQWCADLEGRLWPLRGFEHRSGANGDSRSNSQYGAVLLMIGPGDELSPALLDAVRTLRRDRWLPMYPHARLVIGHRDVYGTDCPGRLAYQAVKAGEFAKAPSDPTKGDPDVALTPQELKDLAAAVWEHEIPDPFHGGTAPAGQLVGQADYYAISGGLAGVFPAAAVSAPGQPTHARDVLSRLDELATAVHALRTILEAQR